MKRWTGFSRRLCAAILDINMLGLSGFAVVARLREREQANRLPPLPVLALTAKALNRDFRAGMAAGITAYLAKPYRREALRGMLAQMMPSPEPG